MNRNTAWILLVAFGCAESTPGAPAPAGSSSRDARSVAISISVGPDQDLNYPSSLVGLPDEHTTFLLPEHGSDRYLVFSASTIVTATTKTAGTVVLQTTDLTNFEFADGYQNPVMFPPVAFSTCDPAFTAEFDENYSAPGSVLRDPRAGHDRNLLMIYEAENHCPGGVHQIPFYATVGVARSRDLGKTWPAPVNAEFGGPDRYPVLKTLAPEPAVAEPSPLAWGNAVPSAFVDGDYIYVTHIYWAGPPGNGDPPNDFRIHVARAKLSDDDGGRLTFSKWNKGSFSTPGIGGVESSPMTSSPCTGVETHPSISRIDQVDLYLLVFVCTAYRTTAGGSEAFEAGWYYSTATSLDHEDWTVPKLIAGSLFPVVTPCGVGGVAFNGFYPSLVSPHMQPGHLGETGRVFFLDGCDQGLPRKFKSRTFTITIAGQDHLTLP